MARRGARRGHPQRQQREPVGVRRRPAGVAGRVVTLSAVAVAVVLVGVFAFAGELRHPLPGEGELVDPDLASDPRDDVECPEPDAVGEDGSPEATDEPVTVASDDLLLCPRTYDGRVVRYEGEAVGEVLERSDHAWVQLNDDAYSQTASLPRRPAHAGGNVGVGVRLPRDEADAIERVGGPSWRGDVLAVQGVFHRAMPDSADAMAIDARQVQRLTPSEPIDRPVLADRRIAAIALAMLAAAMVVAERVVTRRRR